MKKSLSVLFLAFFVAAVAPLHADEPAIVSEQAGADQGQAGEDQGAVQPKKPKKKKVRKSRKGRKHRKHRKGKKPTTPKVDKAAGESATDDAKPGEGAAQ